MLNRIPDIPGITLDHDSYIADYDREFERGGGAMWKLERRQTFREPGDPSWEAFIAGDWTRALELNEEDRAYAREMAQEDRRVGIQTHRVRVVEFPISPYLQWEMQFFRLLAEEGQFLRAIRSDEVKNWENARPLPEIVILGEHVLYEILYDETGTAYGGRRIRDSAVIDECRNELFDMFNEGESILDFFYREIAQLPPPDV